MCEILKIQTFFHSTYRLRTSWEWAEYQTHFQFRSRRYPKNDYQLEVRVRELEVGGVEKVITDTSSPKGNVTDMLDLPRPLLLFAHLGQQSREAEQIESMEATAVMKVVMGQGEGSSVSESSQEKELVMKDMDSLPMEIEGEEELGELIETTVLPYVPTAISVEETMVEGKEDKLTEKVDEVATRTSDCVTPTASSTSKASNKQRASKRLAAREGAQLVTNNTSTK